MPPPFSALTLSRAPLFFRAVLRTMRPHSEEYLTVQRQVFQRNDIEASITELEKGTTLVGLNVNELQPCFVGSPLRKLEALPRLSHEEKTVLLKMRERYFAKVVAFQLLEKINCITTKSANGDSIYHVDPRMVKMDGSVPFQYIEELLFPPVQDNPVFTSRL